MAAPIDVKLEEPTPYLRRLQATVPAGEVDAAFQNTLNSLKNKINIPGFRKGKIPSAVIMQRYRKSVEAEVLGLLLEHRIEDLLAARALTPVTQPKLEPGEIAPGKDFSFSLEFEILPAIGLEGLEELEVGTTPVQVTDEELAARLEQMRQSDAQFRKVEGRVGVIQGDQLLADVVTTVEGKEPQERKGQQLQLGEGNIFPEIEEALLHARIGEPVHAEVAMPETHSNKTMAGKTMHAEMIVREISERILPELDEEWARDHDKESLAELRTEVTAELRKEKERAREQKTDQSILDKVIETRPFDIPPGLARAQTDQRLQTMARIMGQLGAGEELEGEAFESLRRSTRDRAYQDIRRAVVLQAVVKQQGIEVTDAALEEKIAALAQQGPEPPAKIRAHYASKEAREGLRSELQEERAFAFLRSKVKIVERPEQPGEQPQEEKGEPQGTEQG